MASHPVDVLMTSPVDQLLTSTMLSVTAGTIDPDYPITNLVNGNPARPAKFTTTSCTILIDHGSAKPANLVALIHTNLDPALSVRFQANATNSWGSPSYDQPLMIRAPDLRGFVPGAFLDTTASIPTYRYNRLVITSNTVNVVLGQLLIYSAVAPVNALLAGAKRSNIQAGVVHKTPFDVRLAYSWGTKVRRLSGTIMTPVEPGYGDFNIEEWFDASWGMQKPFVLIPDPTGLWQTPDAWFVTWETNPLEGTSFSPTVWTFPCSWLEVSRGLPLAGMASE